MSWKHAGQILSGPPSSSSTSIPSHLRPNSHGLNAFQRERQLVAHYKLKAFDGPAQAARSEWDVLRENHRFIRDDEEPARVSWEERLARAYESKLFKEFALIDLKHFKSRRLALRWRTAPEVVEGIGEDTCASLRCKHHRANPMSPERVAFDTPQSEKYRHEAEQRRRGRMPSLRSFELPFVYEEGGARREALVKVKLCGRCAGKLCWKPGDERGISGKAEGHVGSDVDEDELDGTGRMAGDGKGGRDSQRDRENTDRHRREQEPARRGDERLAQVKASEGDRRTHEDHAREREMVERRAPEGRSLRASRSRSPRRRTQDAKI